MSGLRGRSAIALVARREITQKLREKSFLISMSVTVALVVLVAVVPPLLGMGGRSSYELAVSDPGALPVAKAADRGAKAFDVGLTVRELSPAKAPPRSRTGTSTPCSRRAGSSPRTLRGRSSSASCRPRAARCARPRRSTAPG